jgi:hypothetical protein
VNGAFLKFYFFKIFLLAASVATAQFSHRGFPSMFFLRQTTARAEAMAKAYTSLDGDLGTVFANPAGMATAKNIQALGTHANVRSRFGTQEYRYYGLSFHPFKRITFALSDFSFSNWDGLPTNTPKAVFERRTILTIAAELLPNLYVGVNGNLFLYHPGYDKPNSTFFADMGVTKKIQLVSGVQRHHINIGVSAINLNRSRFDVDLPGGTNSYELPFIAKAGVSYNSQWRRSQSKDTIPFIQVLLQADYQNLLNSDYLTGLRFGAEFTFFDILCVRGGYFSENLDNYGLPNSNRSRIKQTTYGMGVHLPFYKWVHLPFSVHCDYASLPFEQFSYAPNNITFTSFTVGIKYMPIHKKAGM